MSDNTPTSPAPTVVDRIVDSIKAPFVDAASAPHATPEMTALAYCIAGFLLGR